MRGQTNLRTVQKRVNMIENHGENWYKMLHNGQWQILGEYLPILGQIISGTKFDRDKLNFFAEGRCK